jgi:predicted SprT family Zn-dependent metalloprotease
MEKIQLPVIKYTHQEINKKRNQIRKGLISASENVTGGELNCLANSDLELLFQLYDKIFLGGYFQSSKFQGSIIFTLSTRMRTNAGKLVYLKNIKSQDENREYYELKIGVNLFFQYNHLNREKMVNGIKTKDSLHALQLVFEHELCHLIEVHCFQKSNCRQERFKTIAHNIFGHTESYHQLPTKREVAASRYDLRIGDQVHFTHEGKKHTGIISNINVRATVMVPEKNGSYRDDKGKRYNKWYIPLSLLVKK